MANEREIIEVLERALNYLDLACEEACFDGLIWGTGAPVDWDLISTDVRKALYTYHAAKGIARAAADQKLADQLIEAKKEKEALQNELIKVYKDKENLQGELIDIYYQRTINR